MGIENALNVKDLNMSLHYVLDQIAALENLLVSTINYFIKMKKGTLTNEKLNKFQPLVEMVKERHSPEISAPERRLI